MKELKTRFTKVSREDNIIRKAFLDDIIYEALDPAYNFSSVQEAVAYLSNKYKLTLDELTYIKSQLEQPLKTLSKKLK